MEAGSWIEAELPSEALLEHLFDRLWPLCRSLTGDGVRRTFAILQEFIPLVLNEVASGTKLFDWTVPLEWNVRDAYVADPTGKKWIDFKANNLHLLGYSTPTDLTLSLADLQKNLHSLPDQPTAIPYLTSYYSPRWGFCLSDEQRRKLPDVNYRVVIDSTLKAGALTYGEFFLPSTTGSEQEVLLSTYICHPSLANNELSGPLVTVGIYQALSRLARRKFNYRFVFVPETIGALAYLAKYGEHLIAHCAAGFVITCCGDNNKITYKRTRRGAEQVDRSVCQVLLAHQARTGKKYSVLDFFPCGSDERQYGSQGFNLPVGSLMRSMYGTYPEYHTSLDNKDFISFAALRESVELYLHSLLSLELNETYQATVIHGEPMLGPRGLFPSLGSQKSTDEMITKMMYILNFSDGKNDLLSIAERAGTSVTDLAPVAALLLEKELLTRVSRQT